MTMGNKKEQILALIEASYTDQEIIELMKTKSAIVKRYRSEWDENKNSQYISDLASKNRVSVLADTSILADSIAVLALSKEDKAKLTSQITELTEGLKGLSILNSTLQVAAIKITQTIIGSLSVASTASEINMLSSALAKLNDTFFNPNNTNINILNKDGGETNVTPFSKYMRD